MKDMKSTQDFYEDADISRCCHRMKDTVSLKPGTERTVKPLILMEVKEAYRVY
jgi:hypothetical protein